MTAVYSVLLLLAAAGAVTAQNFWKKYVYVSSPMSWPDARDYCVQNYFDLMSIASQDEYNQFTATMAQQRNNYSWIGLNKQPGTINYTQWSDGTLLSFTKWRTTYPLSPSNRDCVLTRNFLWEDFYCNYAKEFICYIWQPQPIVVQDLKSWDDALYYCRTQYTDLLGQNPQQQIYLSYAMSSTGPTNAAWTALRFMDGSWYWTGNKTLAILTSSPSCPVWPFHCAAHDKTGMFQIRDCREKMPFSCFKKDS